MSINDERDGHGADGEPGPAPRAVTYQQAQAGYRSTIDARERFEELSSKFGLDPAGYAAAFRRASEPSPRPGHQREAGQ